MKKTVAFIIFITLTLCGLLCGCNRGDSDKLTEKEYETIGVDHNQCLDNIFIALNKIKTKSDTPPSRKDAKKVIDSVTINYIMQEYDLDKETTNLVLSHITKTKGGSTDIGDFKDKDNLYPFYQNLAKIMDDDDEDLESLISRILSLKLRASVKLSEQEKEEFMPACSVAKNTLQYWYDNAEKWYVVSGQSSAGNTFSWKRLGKEDVKAAIAAATGEAVKTLVFGPVGWKAYLAACVGGAAISSAYDAIEQLWP